MAELSRLHYLQTPAKERLELPSREHWHRFSVLSLSRSSSLTKTKGRSGNKTRYSWHRLSNFQSSSAALFVGALSALLLGRAAAGWLCCLRSTQELSGHHPQHSHHHAWLALGNRAEEFHHRWLWSAVPYLKLKPSCSPSLHLLLLLGDPRCLLWREQAGSSFSIAWAHRWPLVPLRTELRGSRFKPLLGKRRVEKALQLPAINRGGINYSGEKSIHFWVSGMIFKCGKGC